jgi:hypothetical protein
MGYLLTQYSQVAFNARRSINERSAKRAIRGALFYFFLPAFSMAMTREILTGRGGPPDDAEDWTDFLSWATGLSISEAMNMIPFVREASGIPMALLGGGRFFGSETPLQDQISKIDDLAHPQDATEFVADAIRLVSPLLGGFPPEAPLKRVEDAIRGEE